MSAGGKCPCSRVGLVPDLPGNFQNPFKGLRTYAGAAVQRTVHGANRDLRQFGNQRNAALLSRLPHLLLHFQGDRGQVSGVGTNHDLEGPWLNYALHLTIVERQLFRPNLERHRASLACLD